MELRYPLLLIILVIAVSIFLYNQKNKNRNYKKGTKIANTKYIKESNYYKEKLKRYNLLKKIITICSIVSIFISILMISRPSKIEINDSSEYNRDIILCMDVSSSVDDLNRELVDNLKDTVKSLKGERFGISIFNASSVMLVPLTDDYEYVLDVLNKIKESIDTNNFEGNTKYGDDNYFPIKDYIINGTQEGNGSSLIGDGLASCVYSFPNLDEKRTRIIIFSTDNSLAGKPIVDLSTAADISKSKNIKVFGLATNYMNKNDAAAYKEAVEKTGGKYYEHGKEAMTNIISDIESTSKSLLKDQTNTTKSDIPLIPFIFLLISFSVLIILNKKVLQ